MTKIIDLNKSVYELIKEHPELAGIMKSLGFESITNPAMLNTAGRYMTVPKGAAMKKIDLSLVVIELEAKGFKVLRKEHSIYE